MLASLLADISKTVFRLHSHTLIRYMAGGVFLALAISLQADDSLPRYDDGARYAFVSDKLSTRVAVIDTFKHTFLEHLNLEVIPVVMAVGDMSDVLVYSDSKLPQIYVIDLVKRKRWTMALDFVPRELVFHPDGAQLAVAGDNRVQIVDPLQRRLLQHREGFKGPISLNYTADGYSLFITERNSGLVSVWREHDEKTTQFHFGNGQRISKTTLSPDSRLAIAALEEDNILVLWDMDVGQISKKIPLEGVPSRPYVSGTSEDIIVTTSSSMIYVINSWTGEIKRQFTVGKNPQQIRTGWLETIGVVESEGELNVFELEGTKPIQTFETQGSITEMVVVTDTKSLFATQRNSEDLFVFDIRALKPAKRIATGLKMPNLIEMGLTNTACH